MSRIVPPIPPPLRTNTKNAASPNRVDTIPNDNTNNTTRNNVAQNFVNEDLPQLLDSRGGSHVTNVLENRPFVPMSPLSTSTNPLAKPKKQWSSKDRKLANQDKRLKSIIISCLPNDVMKSVIKCTTATATWTGLVNGIFTKLKSLLNDLENNSISIPQDEDSDSDVEEDTRSSSEFLADLNDEFHDRTLLANQKRFYKRFGRFGSAKKPMDKSNETCFAYGKLSLEVDSIRRIQGIGYGVLGGFLEHGYAVSSLMDTTYWSSE
ncbi:hypothetical protein Tco_0394468 [Tanacetum coccineum]